MWANAYSTTAHKYTSIPFWIKKHGRHKQMLRVDVLSRSLKDELTSKQFLDTYTAILVPEISRSHEFTICVSTSPLHCP